MLRIYGASDDLVEIEGHYNTEIDCYNSSVVITVGVQEPDEELKPFGLLIKMTYAPKWIDTGVWTAELSPIDEDVEIPWPVNIKLGGRGYSAEVLIGCPENTPVSFKKISNSLS